MSYLGDYTAVCKTTLGQKIFVDTRDLSLAPHLLLDGNWETWVTEAMKPFFRGSTFIDIGANFGWFSLAAKAFQAKEVAAFEPNPRIFDLLSRTMRINGHHWYLSDRAVSNESKQEILQYDPEMLGGGTLVSTTHFPESKEVQTTTLDTLVQSDENFSKTLGNNPVTIKMDIEGFESRAVFGARELISKRNCSVFVEHNADPTGVLCVREMLEFFEAQSYQLGHIGRDGKIHAILRESLSAVPNSDMLSFLRFPS